MEKGGGINIRNMRKKNCQKKLKKKIEEKKNYGRKQCELYF